MSHSSNGEQLHVIGGVVNEGGTFPGRHVVAAQEDANVVVSDSGVMLMPALRGYPASAQVDVASLRDFSAVRWKDQVTDPRRALTGRQVIVHGGHFAPRAIGTSAGATMGMSSKTFVMLQNGTWNELVPASSSVKMLPRWMQLGPSTPIQGQVYALCCCVRRSYDCLRRHINNFARERPRCAGAGCVGWADNMQVYMLDLNTLVWNATNSSTTLASGVFGHSCSVMEKKLVVIGGVQTSSSNVPENDMSKWQFYGTILMFDLVLLKWSTVQTYVTSLIPSFDH